jgi:AcrR family transcriptional regulator
MTAKRTRGRPPAGDAADRRAAILDAARAQFAAQGFGGTSMRSIAREAGVDVSLISHYFGDKSGLLVATMELPVNPVEKIASVIEDGADGMAERLLRTFLGAWDPHRDVFSSMVRTTLGSGDSQAPMLQLARNILITALLDVLEGDDRELRASLIASQLIGMATMRYVVQLPELADTSTDDVVRLYAPPMQLLITP